MQGDKSVLVHISTELLKEPVANLSLFNLNRCFLLSFEKKLLFSLWGKKQKEEEEEEEGKPFGWLLHEQKLRLFRTESFLLRRPRHTVSPRPSRLFSSQTELLNGNLTKFFLSALVTAP